MTSLFKYNNTGRRCNRCQSDKVELTQVIKEKKNGGIVNEVKAYCHNCEFEEFVGSYPVRPVRPNPPKGFKFPDETDFRLTDIENSPLSIALERTKSLSKRNNDRDFLGAIIFPPNTQEQ